MIQYSPNGATGWQPAKGLIAATFTTMNPDGSINLHRIDSQARFLAHQGVSGVFVCGTTGEGVSLTNAERKAVAARWREVADARMKVIVHVAHNCLADACELAAHAQIIGADAVSAAPPSYYKPRNAQELVACCTHIASAAPNLPFYYYHIPVMTGVSVPMTEFLPLACDRIPTFRGIKFTDEDLMDFASALQLANGTCDVLAGRDEILLAYLALGARGAVGSTYNFLAPVYLEMMDSFGRGDIAAAQRAQAFAREVIAIIAKYGGLPPQKVIMRWLGIDCGPVRLPLVNLTHDQETQLRAELAALGFFERVTT